MTRLTLAMIALPGAVCKQRMHLQISAELQPGELEAQLRRHYVSTK